MDKSVIIRIIVIVVAVATAGVTLYFYNSSGLDASTLPRETVVIERIYTKTEYSTQRTGRHSYVRTNPHSVYYLKVRRADGRSKNYRVKYETYRIASKGDTALLPVGPGRLGWEVADPHGIRIPHPKKPRRRHCRYVGPRPK